MFTANELKFIWGMAVCEFETNSDSLAQPPKEGGYHPDDVQFFTEQRDYARATILKAEVMLAVMDESDPSRNYKF